MFGAIAEGKVSKVQVPTDAAGRPTGKPDVSYSFTDAEGRMHRSTANVRSSWSRPEDRRVEIIYPESDPKVSQLREESGLGRFLLMPLGLLLIVVGGVRYMKSG